MSGLATFYHAERALDEQEGAHAKLSEGATLAVETLLGLLRGSARYAPLGLYAPWAKQSGSLGWEPLAKVDHDLLVYPLSDASVAYVAAHSYGSELPWVAILTDKPVVAEVADAAFDATRYDHFETEAIYRADSGCVTPRIHFLYWAKIHDDVGGGRASLESVATRLGGRLVFPLQLSTGRPRQPPPLPFQVVLDAQLSRDAASGVGAIALPAGYSKCGDGKELHNGWCYDPAEWAALTAAGARASAPPAPRATLGLGMGLAWAGIAGVTGYVFYRTVRPSRGKGKRR